LAAINHGSAPPPPASVSLRLLVARAREDRAADALGRAVGAAQRRVCGLDRRQVLEQPVAVGVGGLRRVEHVVALVVVADQRAQLGRAFGRAFGSALGRRAGARLGGDGGGLGRHGRHSRRRGRGARCDRWILRLPAAPRCGYPAALCPQPERAWTTA